MAVTVTAQHGNQIGLRARPVNGAVYLDDKARKWWRRWEALRAIMPDHEAVRRLAAEILADQPGKDVVVAGRVFRKFNSVRAKQAYIHQHSRDTEWGEDGILASVFGALGYDTVKMNAGGLEYELYAQEKETGLKANVVNLGAERGGIHWELQGYRNPGRGNCMYYTIAQRLERDSARVGERAQQIEALDFAPSVSAQETHGEKDLSEQRHIEALDLTVSTNKSAFFNASFQHQQKYGEFLAEARSYSPSYFRKVSEANRTVLELIERPDPELTPEESEEKVAKAIKEQEEQFEAELKEAAQFNPTPRPC